MSRTAGEFNSLLIKEFSKESDRAAIILVASMFDNALDSLLRNHLIPVSTSEDELFDGPNPPFGTFSAKINIAHRLGLISTNFTRDLHLIRKIRNDFAHNIHGCSLDQPEVGQRISQLCASSKMINELPELRDKFTEGGIGKGARGDFLMIVSWMLYHLVSLSEKIKPLKCADLEAHYCPDILKKAWRDSFSPTTRETGLQVKATTDSGLSNTTKPPEHTSSV